MIDEHLTPSEEEFLIALGAEPIESEPMDGYWCYRFLSPTGDAIRLSFNTHEPSVQTVWESNGRPVCTVVHEGVSRIWIEDKDGCTRILASFAEQRDYKVTLEIQVLPELDIQWATLQI